MILYEYTRKNQHPKTQKMGYCNLKEKNVYLCQMDKAKKQLERKTAGDGEKQMQEGKRPKAGIRKKRGFLAAGIVLLLLLCINIFCRNFSNLIYTRHEHSLSHDQKVHGFKHCISCIKFCCLSDYIGALQCLNA